MLQTLKNLVPEDKRDVATAAGGMVALMLGRKATALALFASGARGLERTWREKHPDFKGGWKERWQHAITFYEETHQEPTNRLLHQIGIPMIVGGAVGLLAMPAYTPPWWASLGSWTVGWGLNFVGHGVYEKNAPAFQDDPLSFLAGPIWDLQQLRKKVTGAPAPAAHATAA